MKFLFFSLFCLFAESFASEIKFIPFRISTYARVTPENMDEFCPLKGTFAFKSLGLLSVEKCAKKPTSKINVRGYIFEAPDTLVLIGQNHEIWFNNFVCDLKKEDSVKIIKELESFFKGQEGKCKT